MKWLDKMKSNQYSYATGQLRYDNYFCPLGVLCDFLDPNGWTLLWDETSYAWHGEQFKLPEWARQKCKMKTIWGPEISSQLTIDRNGKSHIMNLTEIFDGCSDWRYPIELVESHYELI